MAEKLRRIPYYGTWLLLAYMPFHVFLAQSLSLLTGGLDVWKVAKDFVTIGLLVLAVGLVVLHRRLRTSRVFMIILALSIVYGVLHIATYAANKDTTLSVALLASAYNNRLLWYFLIGLAGVLLIKEKRLPARFTTAIIAVSTIVCLLGLLQWFLPKDILTHLGYSVERGVKAAFFINDDTNFPRVMSTIRDPNSLGAFLLIPCALLASFLADAKKDKRRLITGLLMLHILILFLTFSRAAWGGALVASAVLLYVHHRQKAHELLKRYWVVLCLIVLVAAAGLYSQRQAPLVRSVIFRIDDKNPAADLDSDQLHYYSVEKGVRGIVRKPLGHGPGTAGIVSIQNAKGSFLTENYYIQIGYEVGMLGLLVFVAAWLWIMKLLYDQNTMASHALFAVGVAYVLMAFVMHLWSNEAVAATWWLLAGATLGLRHSKAKNPPGILWKI